MAHMTYNGFGYPSTCSDGAQLTSYHYNHGIGNHPMVGERDETGTAWQRYYVYTPQGLLMYLIDVSEGNSVSFYHADQVGTTLFLTDSSGSVTDAYAYTPYGRLLGHTGSSDQQFTYIGTRGVRQVTTGGNVYQMGLRYYDALTGRFTSRDVMSPMPGVPRSLNPYQYGYCNPLRYVDSSGLRTDVAVNQPAGASPPSFRVQDHKSANESTGLLPFNTDGDLHTPNTQGYNGMNGQEMSDYVFGGGGSSGFGGLRVDDMGDNTCERWEEVDPIEFDLSWGVAVAGIKIIRGGTSLYHWGRIILGYAGVHPGVQAGLAALHIVTHIIQESVEGTGVTSSTTVLRELKRTEAENERHYMQLESYNAPSEPLVRDAQKPWQWERPEQRPAFVRSYTP